MKVASEYYSKLGHTNRIDAEYYQQEYRSNREMIDIYFQGIVYLGQISKSIVKGIFDIKADSYAKDGIPFIRISNLREGLILDNNIAHIPEDIHCIEKKTKLSVGDIVLSKTAYAAAALVHFNDCNISQDIIGIQLRENWKTKISSAYINIFLNTNYGLKLLEQCFTGNIQMHLALDYVKRIPIPTMKRSLQLQIEALYWEARKQHELSHRIYNKTGNLLLSKLGLNPAFFSNKQYYTKRFSVIQLSGRLDAEYYHPKYDELFDLMEKNADYCRQVKTIAEYNSRGLQPDYAENGELRVINSQHILEQCLDYDGFDRTNAINWASQSKARVFKNDILTYTTGANVGRTSVYLENEKTLASNHVNILRIRGENPIYVGCVMNSVIGRMQTRRLITGSAQAELYPSDIDQFLIPFVDIDTQDEIVRCVIEAHQAKKIAKALLEIAKRAVEIAIEENEDSAQTWLKEEAVRVGLHL